MPERFIQVRRADGHVLAEIAVNQTDVPVVTFEKPHPEQERWVVELFPAEEVLSVEQEAASPTGSPHVELFIDKAGEARFRIVASNGEIVAASEGYKGRGGKRNARKMAERFALPITEA